MSRLQRLRIADRAAMMENGDKVADIEKHEMTTGELDYIIRDGGRQVGEAAAWRSAPEQLT